MAVPFNIPDEQEESSSSSAQNMTQTSSTPVTPIRPTSIPIPIQNRVSQQSSQHSPVDNEILVQAFYEALCRCSQINTPSTSTASSPILTHFWYPQYSPSQSTNSSPRNSFRSNHRRRLNSYGSQSQYSQYSEDISYENDLSQWEQHYQQREEMEEFMEEVPKEIKKKSKDQKHKNSKITNFVISALQFVIDTLK
ncbi:hypothetical protein PVAND_010708 [Polypedilum vanderplanki]|uniref:Uncharacterized protein n=1 Tax=Polypedilum vanderplanki TaxID=319348 RepID=A0A9J6CGF0_POLVA|nr:hypothetical protein PVAND_010708 [Polypedilum vanderplanki]